MRHLTLGLLTLCMLTSCTGFSDPRPGFDRTLAKHCEAGDVRCVTTAMDSVKDEDQGGYRLEFMEGFATPNLTNMLDNGRLTVETMPVWAYAAMVVTLVPMPGLTAFKQTYYGGMYECNIWFTPDSWNQVLIHELQHCQGFGESGLYPNFLIPGYSDKQKEIMKQEGVDKWSDTDYYRILKMDETFTWPEFK